MKKTIEQTCGSDHWRTLDEAKSLGFATFNPGRHLVVDIPPDNSCITCNLPDGNQITFAFVPYRDGGNPRCVDIKEHHKGPQYTHKRQKFEPGEAPEQKAIVFQGGVGRVDASGTLTTILLHSEDR